MTKGVYFRTDSRRFGRNITTIALVILVRLGKTTRLVKAIVMRLLLSLLLLVPLANVVALSPEFEVDRLILHAEEDIKAGQFSRAESTLNEVDNLGVTPPSLYHYLLATVLEQKQSYQKATQEYERYVEAAGKEGLYYEQSLRKITRLNRAQRTTEQATTSDGSADIEWSATPVATNDYQEHIQFLYQRDNATDALLHHINNLLTFYGYGDKSIRSASNVQEPRRYSVHIDKPGALVVTKRRAMAQREEITNERVPVYGINPYVDFRCQTETSSCAILHPVTGKQWLQIVNNRQAVEELAKALSELIKILQSH